MYVSLSYKFTFKTRLLYNCLLIFCTVRKLNYNFTCDQANVLKHKSMFYS